MDKETQREHRCCFTGHRPEKLTISEARLAELLEAEIKKAIDRQFTTFITGMAKGTDLIAAEIVLRLREEDPRLRLVAALPYPNFGQRWGGGWSERFQRVLSTADQIECVCPCSSWASYQLRNEWMVNHSALVIAAFNGESGGTKNTLDFARKQRVPCVVIDIGGKL